MKTASYRGDCTAAYDPTTGAGMLGKVVGPDARGAWHRATSATYDAATDTTIVTLTALVHPSHRLDQLLA